MKKQVSLSLFFCFLSLFLMSDSAFAADLQKQLTGESAIEQIVKRGNIRVGLDVFVPWAMKDKTGKLIGF